MSLSPSEKDGLRSAAYDFLAGYTDEIVAFAEEYPDETVFQIHRDWFADDDDLPDVIYDWYSTPDVVQETIERELVTQISELVERETLDADALSFNPDALSHKDITARLVGYDDENVYDVGHYRPDNVSGRMIPIRGQVTLRSKRKLRDDIIAYECLRCGRTTRISQQGQEIRTPHECSGCERSGPFREIDRQSETRNYQHIRVQTLPEEADGGESEMIDLQLFDDLVGELAPGDRAVLNVIVRSKREQKQSRIKELYGTVHSLVKLTSDHTDIAIEPYEDEIREIAADDPFTKIIESVAPFHEGDKHVKEAIALQLFGGVEKRLPDGSWFRGNSHLLLMGDPGTGKTAIIRYISNLTPRSEYATGKKTTSAGLTATAVKDEFADGGWTLQAGTLVRAHNGVAAIDELDKMDADDRDGMIEAMSEQKITVSMVVSGVLPAKCSVVAAANPKYGSFDPMKDVGQQLDLDSVLLSRFDLWFVMRDTPDEEKDTDISSSMTDTAQLGQKVAAGQELTEEEMAESAPPIPPEMFKAYVALGKSIAPIFTDEAKDRITEKYVDLRQFNEDEDGPIPVTARLTEALHRLSEASARIRLSEEVEIEDVDRAIDIMMKSLETMGIDPETGELDAARFETGKTSTEHDRASTLKGVIEGLTGDAGESPRVADVKEEAMVIMSETDFEETMDRLRKEDEIYQPEHGKVKTL